MRLSDIVRKNFSYIPGMDLSNPDPKEKKHSLWRFFIFFQAMVFLYFGAYFSNFFSRKCLYFGLELSISKPEKQKRPPWKIPHIFSKMSFSYISEWNIAIAFQKVALIFPDETIPTPGKNNPRKQKESQKKFLIFFQKRFFSCFGINKKLPKTKIPWNGCW